MSWNKTALILGATFVLVVSSRPMDGQEKRGGNLDGVSMHLGDTLMAPVAPRKRPKEDGLALEAEFDFRREYLVGEPLLVRVSIANYGKKPVTLSYGDRLLQKNSIFFDIKGPDGKPVPKLVSELRDSAGPQPLVIESGRRLVEWYSLLDEYPITRLGEYDINVRYESDGKSLHPASGRARDDLWKGKLDRSIGKVKIVEPSRPEDKAALEWLVANPPLGKRRPEYRFVHLFPTLEPGEAPHFAGFLKEHGKSRYAAYARFADGLGALHRVARGTPSYAKQAVESLVAIDPAGYPALLAERRLFHLIQAHSNAGSNPKQIGRLVKDFLGSYPDSPYVSPVQQAAP